MITWLIYLFWASIIGFVAYVKYHQYKTKQKKTQVAKVKIEAQQRATKERKQIAQWELKAD